MRIERDKMREGDEVVTVHGSLSLSSMKRDGGGVAEIFWRGSIVRFSSCALCGDAAGVGEDRRGCAQGSQG